MSDGALDLGDGHTLTSHSWSPDRDLNPQYADLLDVQRYGAIVTHKRPDGEECISGITFGGEVSRRFDDRPIWKMARRAITYAGKE